MYIPILGAIPTKTADTVLDPTNSPFAPESFGSYLNESIAGVLRLRHWAQSLFEIVSIGENILRYPELQGTGEDIKRILQGLDAFIEKISDLYRKEIYINAPGKKGFFPDMAPSKGLLSMEYMSIVSVILMQMAQNPNYYSEMLDILTDWRPITNQVTDLTMNLDDMPNPLIAQIQTYMDGVLA